MKNFRNKKSLKPNNFKGVKLIIFKSCCKRVENKTVAVRKRGEGDKGAIGLPGFIEMVREDIALKR